MNRKRKKPYARPEIRMVELVAQEAVLAGCKTTTDPSGKNAGQNSCGTRDYWCDQTAS